MNSSSMQYTVDVRDEVFRCHVRDEVFRCQA
jgi:hypothetical protein